MTTGNRQSGNLAIWQSGNPAIWQIKSSPSEIECVEAKTEPDAEPDPGARKRVT